MKKKKRFRKPKKRNIDDNKEFYKVLQGKSDLGEEIDTLVDKAEKMARDYELALKKALKEGRLIEESPYRKIIEIYKRIVDNFISKGWKDQALIYADQIKFYQDKWERDKKLRKLEYQKIQRHKNYRDSSKVKAISEIRRRFNYDDPKPYIKRRFEEREGIRGFIICDSNGLPIDSNMDIEISEEFSAYVTSLIGKAKQLVQALKEGGLKFIRLETSKGEIMIALEEQLILIILKGEKGEKRVRNRDGGDRFPYPYIFTHPRPPDDFAPAAQVQIRAPLKKKTPKTKNIANIAGLSLLKKNNLLTPVRKSLNKSDKNFLNFLYLLII